ncbi:unnamed protein product [Heligmosomoides polygyrus]|uniref:FecR domain-containing protein n=1 Tax=Heligmosomoides polygyrus TaxID=6339 RepID=A0A183FZC5_HELPZ|nr:unnamed protein product [Heligmosomoides polygyrus]
MSEQLRHESQRYQSCLAEELCRKKPKHCLDGFSARNITRQWVMKERAPFKMDLRNLLERWRPHCNCSDQGYYAHAIDLMHHYFSDACHPEDAIKKYSIRRHGNAGRSVLISVPERIVFSLIDFVLDAPWLSHEDLSMSLSRVKARSSLWAFVTFFIVSFFALSTITFPGFDGSSATLMKSERTEVRAYSFVAEGVPLAPKGIVLLPLGRAITDQGNRNGRIVYPSAVSILEQDENAVVLKATDIRIVAHGDSQQLTPSVIITKIDGHARVTNRKHVVTILYDGTDGLELVPSAMVAGSVFRAGGASVLCLCWIELVIKSSVDYTVVLIYALVSRSVGRAGAASVLCLCAVPFLIKSSAVRLICLAG